MVEHELSFLEAVLVNIEHGTVPVQSVLLVNRITKSVGHTDAVRFFVDVLIEVELIFKSAATTPINAVLRGQRFGELCIRDHSIELLDRRGSHSDCHYMCFRQAGHEMDD